jgi:hypothetical protein
MEGQAGTGLRNEACLSADCSEGSFSLCQGHPISPGTMGRNPAALLEMQRQALDLGSYVIRQGG